jgi:uncharacterized protein
MASKDKNNTGGDYPSLITLRVMGEAHEDFSKTVLEIVRKHSPEVDLSAIKIRASRRGNYVSVNISFQVESKEQYSAIYQDLQSNHQILMVL